MFRKFNKYFKIYWATIFCLLALCVTILMVTGYNSQKREKENKESLSQMTQFEQERKELEFKVATVISLGRTLTEYRGEIRTDREQLLTLLPNWIKARELEELPQILSLVRHL